MKHIEQKLSQLERVAETLRQHLDRVIDTGNTEQIRAAACASIDAFLAAGKVDEQIFERRIKARVEAQKISDHLEREG